jgi:hydrogenase/urease accessory protein HupE
MLVLPPAWLVGGWIGLAATPPPAPAVGVVSLVLLGGLVAADLAWPPRITVGLAAVLGLVHGFENGGALARTAGGGLELLGVTTAVFLVVTLVAAGVAALRPPWARLAVRVAGSWIAAVGLLLLGWWIRGALA